MPGASRPGTTTSRILGRRFPVASIRITAASRGDSKMNEHRGEAAGGGDHHQGLRREIATSDG